MHTNSLPPTDRDEQSTPELRTPNSALRTPKSYNTVLRDQLRALRDDGSKWSNASIARSVGCSPAVISQYLNERGCIYDGDIPNLERRIQDFLAVQSRRRASGIATCPSEVANQMLGAFNSLRAHNAIGVITSTSGNGRSRGVEMIRQACPTALLLTVRMWNCDKGGVMSAIWDRVPHAGYTPGTPRMEFVVNSQRVGQLPMLVDDADKLTLPALAVLFDLHEETGMPIGLCSDPSIMEKIARIPRAFSSLHFEFGIKRPLDKKGVEQNDTALIEKMVEAIIPSANGEFDALVETCQQIVSGPGHYKRLESALKNAVDQHEGAKKRNRPISWVTALDHAQGLLPQVPSRRHLKNNSPKAITA